MSEVFKKIFADYDVNTSGIVRSWKSGAPVVLSPQPDNKGYLRVDLWIDGKRKTFKVHRLVAQAFIPNPNDKPCVNHKNGIKTDNRVENLEWVTNAENQRHAVATGLKAQGEDNYKAKLTNEQARYIRDNPDGLTCAELGKMFGVQQVTISLIQLGKTFKNAGSSVRQSKVPRVPDNVRAEIRYLYNQGGISKSTLAKQFGVCQKTVCNIIHEEPKTDF